MCQAIRRVRFVTVDVWFTRDSRVVGIAKPPWMYVFEFVLMLIDLMFTHLPALNRPVKICKRFL